MSYRNKILLLVGYCLVIAGLVVYQLTQYGIFFHTDIARDFLLFDDIIHTNPITLIGPRSGGISGVFHGPAWLYLNIPAIVLGGGNPISQGIFWIFLTFFASVIVGICTHILTKNRTVSVLGGSIAFALYAHSTLQLFNPFGAILLSPIAFTALVLYFARPTFLRVSTVILTIGTMIQFQMAFAVPLLFLVSPLLIVKLIRNRRYKDISAFFLLIIPLSTFVIFDIRHEMLQFNAIIQYAKGSAHIAQSFNFSYAALLRARSFIEGVNLLPSWYNLLIFLYFGYAFTQRARFNNKQRNILFLYLYLYLGYWIVTLPYKGEIWGYYTAPFAPLTIVAMLSTFVVFSRYFKYSLVICILGFLMYAIVIDAQGAKEKASMPGFWSFYAKVAEVVFIDAPQEFGYFIYTPDEFGYSEKYAMRYKDILTNKKGFENVKKDTVYLLIAPVPSDRPGLSSEWWKEKRVGINKKPQRVWKINGYKVEKYILSNAEQKVPSDSTLINSLIFR